MGLAHVLQIWCYKMQNCGSKLLSWCILGPFCRSIFKLTDRHTPRRGLIYREQANSGGSLTDRVTYLSRLLLRSIRLFVVAYVLYTSRASGWSRLKSELYTEYFLRLEYARIFFPNTESIIFIKIICNDLNNKHMKDILQYVICSNM